MKFNEMISGNTPVLVDFYADWCGPCKVMAPILKQLKERKGEAVKILKVDVDSNRAVSEAFRITGIPTLILFKNKQPVWRQSGVVPLTELEKVIDRFRN